MSRSESWRERAGELAAAFALLTRLPAGRSVPPDETQAVWAYPIVGATVGLIGGVAYWLLFSLSCPPVLAALLAVGRELIAREPRLRLDYLELRSEGSFAPLPTGPVHHGRILVAAFLGEDGPRPTRLIDNMSLASIDDPS